MAALTAGEESLRADESAIGPAPVNGRPEARGQDFLSRLAEMTADVVRASLERHECGSCATSAAGGRLPALY